MIRSSENAKARTNQNSVSSHAFKSLEELKKSNIRQKQHEITAIFQSSANGTAYPRGLMS